MERENKLLKYINYISDRHTFYVHIIHMNPFYSFSQKKTEKLLTLIICALLLK